jgi:tryptophan halogenase
MVREVVIVGGGSAGWMTAAYLRRALPSLDRVTVVESPRIGTVGVGEASFSTIKIFFDSLGLEERDWMPACNATYKLGVKFFNWTARPGQFVHPFQRYPVVDGFDLANWWLKLGRELSGPFDAACFVVPALCEARRSPRYLDGRVFDDTVGGYYTGVGGDLTLAEHEVQYPYGYHLDADLLGKFLRGYATGRGVQHIVDEVVNVGVGQDGRITHVQTREHGSISGDLFVDCSGFRGLLINQALGEPFVSYSDSLPCDSAVALRVPFSGDSDDINPFTGASALSSGWVWDIPLYTRIGTGYVYSASFLSAEEAESELRRHLGPRAERSEAWHIRMRLGRNRNAWVKNCASIGLASGFVEPLESSGLFFIQHAVEELVGVLKAGPPDQPSIERYNHKMAGCIDGVREFLTIHYTVTDREDSPFWKACKDLVVPAEMEERLARWQRRLPGPSTIKAEFHGFEPYSYSVLLLGMNHRPEAPPELDDLDPERARLMFRSVRERAEHLVSTLPSHVEYLRQVRGLGEPEHTAAEPVGPSEAQAQLMLD